MKSASAVGCLRPSWTEYSPQGHGQGDEDLPLTTRLIGAGDTNKCTTELGSSGSQCSMAE